MTGWAPRWLVVALALTTVLGAAAGAQAGSTDPLGQLALPLLDGSRFLRLDEYAGQPVVLNFWRSDCPACRAEWPVLRADAATHGEVGFIAVAVDARQSARDWLARQPLPWAQAWAPLAAAQLLERAGNLSGGLPYTVLLDAEHRPCASHLGQLPEGWLRTALAACR